MGLRQEIFQPALAIPMGPGLSGISIDSMYSNDINPCVIRGIAVTPNDTLRGIVELE